MDDDVCVLRLFGELVGVVQGALDNLETKLGLE